jgi:hypothetical protein
VAVKPPNVAVMIAVLLPFVLPEAGLPVEVVAFAATVKEVAPVGGLVFQFTP